MTITITGTNDRDENYMVSAEIDDKENKEFFKAHVSMVLDEMIIALNKLRQC